MSNHAKALEKIKELVEKYSKGGYIFRGTATMYSSQKGEGKIRDGINSTLYRWVVKGKKDKEGNISKEQETLKKIFAENENFSPADMEKEIVENARKMFPSSTEAHEILTDLQHFGGITNMMDFTRNMYVALFFACKSHFRRKGELLALHENELIRISEINYNSPLHKGKLEIINPAGAQSSQLRVHSQGSVFVRPPNGYIKPELCNISKIARRYKKPILEYLRTFHNITAETIYNDLYGFINNERNKETPSLRLYLGLENQKRGEYTKAIKRYNECLAANSSMALAYYHRGRAHFDMEKYDLAVDDFSWVIYYQKDNLDAYLHRGNARIKYGMPELAVEDYAHVVRHNERHAEAHYRLGKAYDYSGMHESAVLSFGNALHFKYDFAKICNARGIAFLKWYKKDLPREIERKKAGIKTSERDKRLIALENFDMAIKHSPNYAEAYWHRARVKRSLGKKEEAKNDEMKWVELLQKERKK